MYSISVVLCALLATASCRYLLVEEPSEWEARLISDSPSERDWEEAVHPGHLRLRRQAHGVLNTNPDGSANVMAKFALTRRDNILGADDWIEDTNDGGFKDGHAGLAWDNVNGHGLPLTGRHIPNVGHQMMGAGKIYMFRNEDHSQTSNAVDTRTYPNNPAIPNFNTVGGGVHYMFKDKVGGSPGASHTDLFKKTDYSVKGKPNLSRNPSLSLKFFSQFSGEIEDYISN